MARKINLKREIEEMVKLADDLHYLNDSICVLTLRGLECEQCGECIKDEIC